MSTGERIRSCIFAKRKLVLVDMKKNEWGYRYCCEIGMYDKDVGCGERRCAYYTHRDPEKKKEIFTFRKIKEN